MTDTRLACRKELCIGRREFLIATAGLGAAVAGCYDLGNERGLKATTFVGKAASYDEDLATKLVQGLHELEIRTDQIRGKKILLKPNLVEPHLERDHIVTHPLFIHAAAQAFLKLEAGSVVVAEGPGHRRDFQLILHESGLADLLGLEKLPYFDLNNADLMTVTNRGRRTGLKSLALPQLLKEVDWIVSLAKMKTHHWTGVTLSMKNLFGVMPGIIYGWPKNVLHWHGIDDSILDICQTVQPHLAIIDGIVGMEGDGPIMGTPVQSGVFVMGKNLPAVDATAARVMGIDPLKIDYLWESSGVLGPILEDNIGQRGESPKAVRKDFELLDYIRAHQGIRLV